VLHICEPPQQSTCALMFTYVEATDANVMRLGTVTPAPADGRLDLNDKG